MAEISLTRSPGVCSARARKRLKVSRPERPASTRMRVELVATTAEFPRLPLASTETETHIPVSLPWGAVETGTDFDRPVPSRETAKGAAEDESSQAVKSAIMSRRSKLATQAGDPV